MPKTQVMPSVVCALWSTFAACSEPEDARGAASPDARAAVDARPAGDARPGADSPSARDVGTTADGGLVSDASPAGDAGRPPDAGVPLRVLFVGNSYTSVNDLPAAVRALGAATPGGGVEVEAITKGGARLSDHWAVPATQARIADGGFDAVVLQGQSVEPILAFEEFDYHASLFSGAMREAGVAGVWFATWARREGDATYAELGLGDPVSMAQLLDLRYRMVAERDAGVVARVGAAWELARLELPEVALHVADGSHPTGAGTLLAACVMLQALTGQTPRLPDPPPLGVDRPTAEALCALAPRVRCLEGMAFCEGACIDIDWDAENCGTCGNVCPDDTPCRQRLCGCAAGQTGCARACVDLQSDPENCGACGEACPVGGVCSGAECACPTAGFRDYDLLQLAAQRPACDTDDDFGSVECNAAAHLHCRTTDCFNSGLSPPSGHSAAFETSTWGRALACVAGDVRSTTYTELQTFAPACDGLGERGGQACATAISRYCTSVGAVSGFGPVESAGDEVTVTCVTNATRVSTTLEALSAFVSRCVPDPVTCSLAAWGLCETTGHKGGFGPVEIVGSDLEVVCLD